MRHKILEFLHQKDLISSVDISAPPQRKSSSTVLLVIEEDLDENYLNAINYALRAHKDFSEGGYHIVNWAAYNLKGSVSDEDEPMLEVADNYMRTPRAAIMKNRKRFTEE